PALVLRTLERLVESRERGRWWAFLREFHQQSRYRHPTTAGFQELLAQRCGPALADWFRSAIAAGAVLDYGVFGTPSQEPGRCEVAVRRYGALPADVKVRFTFSNGPVEFRSIDAFDPGPLWRFTFKDEPGKERGDLREVWVDPPELPAWLEERAVPCGLQLLDADLTNNAWRKTADPAPAVHRGLRALLQAQCELTFAGAIG
ncbi:MAG TPA: hypothetical protein VK348_07245, partial [Planctomycetota bacterium]|nr:hypothetical protein [Planctomycetota bacterium]